MNDACHCGKQAETSFQHLGPLCRGCFSEVIQRRCRKAAKDAGWFAQGQKIHIINDGTLQNNSVRHLFRQVVKGIPLEEVAAEKAEIVILGKTADDEAEDFLQQLFEGKLSETNAINLLANVSTAELEKYCEFEGITGDKKPASELRRKLEALEQKYPGTMFALQKGKDSFKHRKSTSL
jgi:hypothetical protein